MYRYSLFLAFALTVSFSHGMEQSLADNQKGEKEVVSDAALTMEKLMEKVKKEAASHGMKMSETDVESAVARYLEKQRKEEAESEKREKTIEKFKRVAKEKAKKMGIEPSEEILQQLAEQQYRKIEKQRLSDKLKKTKSKAHVQLSPQLARGQKFPGFRLRKVMSGQL